MKTSSSRFEVSVLLGTQTLFNIGFYAVVPFLAVVLANDFLLAGTAVGLILGVRTFAQQGLFLAGGSLADRFGARIMILIGCAVRASGFLMLAASLWGSRPILWLFILGTLFTGFGGALFSPGLNILVAQCPEGTRSAAGRRSQTRYALCLVEHHRRNRRRHRTAGRRRPVGMGFFDGCRFWICLFYRHRHLPCRGPAQAGNHRRPEPIRQLCPRAASSQRKPAAVPQGPEVPCILRTARSGPPGLQSALPRHPARARTAESSDPVAGGDLRVDFHPDLGPPASSFMGCRSHRRRRPPCAADICSAPWDSACSHLFQPRPSNQTRGCCGFSAPSPC